MKNTVSLIIDDQPHPHRMWARSGIPEGIPVAATLETCTTEYVSFLPGASRVDAGFLEQAVDWLDRYPEVNLMMGRSIVRFDHPGEDRVRNLGGLQETRYLDPDNFGREIVFADAPFDFGWEGIVFRTSALKALGADHAWSTVMILGLQKGVLLENRRVSSSLVGEATAGSRETVPEQLQQVRAIANTAIEHLGDSGVPEKWATLVGDRLIEEAVQRANQSFKAAREQVRDADPSAVLWLKATGLLRRQMEKRLRTQYERARV